MAHETLVKEETNMRGEYVFLMQIKYSLLYNFVSIYFILKLTGTDIPTIFCFEYYILTIVRTVLSGRLVTND